MSIPLAVALTSDPSDLAPHVLAHYTTTCRDCAGATCWPLLCEQHAPLARAIIDPGYYQALLHTQSYWREQLVRLRDTIVLREKMAQMVGWLERNPASPKRPEAEAKLATVTRQCAPSYRTIPAADLEATVARIGDQLAWYGDRIGAIRDATTSFFR